MKMHHAFSLPALVAAGALCWAAPPPAWAQAAPQTLTDPSTGLAVQTVSSATVKISGTVSGGTESVALSGTGGFPSARTGLARFSFAYDVNTGVLTSASGSLTSP